MRVLFIPGYAGNPYQDELARALRELGVDVEGVGGLGPAEIRERVRLFAEFDIVHLHWTHGYIEGRSRRARIGNALRFLLCVALSRTRGTRFVWTIHNLIAHRRPDLAVETRFARTLIGLAAAAVVHCEAAAASVAETYRLGRRGRKKVVVIPHGSYVGAYPDEISSDDARRRLDVAGARCVYLSLGQIRGYKGLDRLLDAFGTADADDRLIIAGRPKDSRYANRIADRARTDPRVRLVLEHVPDDELQVYLRAADVVVLPYERSLTSGAAILAMSFGRTIVMPRIGCATAMLSHQTDLLYDQGDQGGLARAMERAATSDREALGAANLEAIAPVTWDAVASATLAVYEHASR